MKKLFAIALALFICFGCIGCRTSSAGTETIDQKTATESQETEPTIYSENICFSFDFQAHQGMNISVWGIPSMEEGWNELFLRSEKTTGGVESYTVSIGKEIIDELEGVYFGCYNEGDAYMYGTYLIKMT